MGCYYVIGMSLYVTLCAYFRHESEVLAVLVFQLRVQRTFLCLRFESERQHSLVLQVIV